MKQKKQNRILAALLAVVMMFQMLPMMAFAAEGDGAGSTEGEVSVNNNERFKEAVQSVPANGEITIHLGAGTYTLYEGDGPNRSLVKSGVKIHLVGEGIDITTLEIGGPLNDPPAGFKEQGSDYSFGGADTVTFEDMTLTTRYQRDYQGFSHINNETSVDRCKINGYTAYWGYNSATFTNTTFEPKFNKYALWTYCSPTMTFDNCKFDCKWKAIKVYNEGTPIEVHFKDCTVTGCTYKSALQIDDNFANFKIYISGDNNVDAQRDTYTCSKVYGFGNNSANHGKTEVYIGEGGNAELVWKDGKMVTHKHSDGEKDNKLTNTYTDWEEKGDHSERKVTTTCGYCHYTTNGVEKGYKLAYDLNGGGAAAGADYTEKIVAENKTVTLAAAPAPAQEGVYFLGWDDGNGKQYNADAPITLTANTTLTAQWGDVPPVEPGTPAGGGSGDGGAGAVVAGALLGGAGYLLGTRLWLEGTFGFVPSNRIELAMALWKRADCPAPVSTELYPDIDEDDTDAQAAARWCVEQDLMKDFARTNSDGTQTVKFRPYDYVFRPQSLVKWYKLEKLLNEQQSTNA